MICHYCNQEAAAKCVNCGLAICPAHGPRYCPVCSEAVFTTDLPGSHGQAYLQCEPKPRMQTIYLDDDGPPECYRCGAIARRVCQNCHNLYCREHAGTDQWCDQCARAARVGTWLTAGIVAVIVVLAVLFYFLGRNAP
jgi:hypothetical protein